MFGINKLKKRVSELETKTSTQNIRIECLLDRVFLLENPSKFKCRDRVVYKHDDVEIHGMMLEPILINENSYRYWKYTFLPDDKDVVYKCVEGNFVFEEKQTEQA